MMLLFKCIVKQLLSSRQNQVLRKPYYFTLLISQRIKILLACELISATSVATQTVQENIKQTVKP